MRHLRRNPDTSTELPEVIEEVEELEEAVEDLEERLRVVERWVKHHTARLLQLEQGKS